jgi:transposase-like protein
MKKRSPRSKADWKKLNRELIMIRNYLHDGYTAKQIAEMYNVTQTLFFEWMSKKAFELK